MCCMEIVNPLICLIVIISQHLNFISIHTIKIVKQADRLSRNQLLWLNPTTETPNVLNNKNCTLYKNVSVSWKIEMVYHSNKLSE